MKKLALFGLIVLCGTTVMAGPHHGGHHGGSRGTCKARVVLDLVGASITAMTGHRPPPPCRPCPPPPPPPPCRPCPPPPPPRYVPPRRHHVPHHPAPPPHRPGRRH